MKEVKSKKRETRGMRDERGRDRSKREMNSSPQTETEKTGSEELKKSANKLHDSAHLIFIGNKRRISCFR